MASPVFPIVFYTFTDIYVKLTEDTLHGVDEAKLGALLIDLFPFLAYLLHWLPGCSSLTATARHWRPATRKVHNYPFDDVWKQVEAGIAQPSFLSSHLEQFNLEDAKEYDMKLLDGIHPVAPQGIAHRTTDDDVYNGMFIPKGSVIIPNIMAMSRDEMIYKDSEAFNPEHFLSASKGPGEPYLGAIFSFGRRICPGRHFAENGVWIIIATILASFDICKAIGKNGKAVEPDVAFTMDRLASHPESFECVFRPRSEMAKKLIMQQSTSDEL
ncbi:hypothetical protein SCP_1602400 [Sparassis crispa]|uniref:Cytochrome P450 n=1 Tax=Sparassis crispa TaxID=139825 RepID=A0A401H558_9APHY|nr:hypothetical protein SCP_1602400 [Sparassis crispa]GBE89577.1 hypothetical protein SCP_1602400 [Sparassis crispa]